MRYIIAILIFFAGLAFTKAALGELPILNSDGEIEIPFREAFKNAVREEVNNDQYNALILEAIEEDDLALAQSYIRLADDLNFTVDKSLLQRAAEEKTIDDYAVGATAGCLTGNIDTTAHLLGTIACDLFLVGDIRDILIEGGKELSPEKDADRIILGLSVAGAATSVGALFTAGAVGPADIGASALKNAKRAGRVSEEFTAELARETGRIIDPPQLQRLVNATGSSTVNIFTEFPGFFANIRRNGKIDWDYPKRVVSPFRRELDDYGAYVAKLPISKTLSDLGQVNANLTRNSARWDAPIFGASETTKLLGDIPIRGGGAAIPAVKTSDEIAELVTMSAKLGPDTRAGVKLLGAKTIRGLKITKKVGEFLLERLTAFIPALLGFLLAVFWLFLTSGDRKRTAR